MSYLRPTDDVVAALSRAPSSAAELVRVRRQMFGIVQGVGFRPTVANHASQFPITGFVGNDDAGVFIEAQGKPMDVVAFFTALDDGLPPLSQVDYSTCRLVAPVRNERAFQIVPSAHSEGAVTLIPPDVAPCEDCQREMADPDNRRFGYPFISCTNCGPRLSIIVDVPYDRPLTTMAGFPMCDACASEYANPTDRRYHAQPISCFDCGPTLWLEAAGHPATPPMLDGPARREAWAKTIRDAQHLLDRGAIIAVKGIGGFTLFCDARNGDAVARLRQRKHRPDKPFATMCADVDSARQLADVDRETAAAMFNQARPIVLAPMADDYDLADVVAPRLDRIGIMLPSAPLHMLLVRPGFCYVATSGNLSGEPLASKNDDARQRLAGIVDYFLMNDRPIHASVEDSVTMVGGANLPPVEPVLPAGRTLGRLGAPRRDGLLVHDDQESLVPIRRSRGYAPMPVRLTKPGQPVSNVSVLAVGGELKNTFALVRDGMAFCSPHLGDMAALASQQAFAASVDQLMRMHRRVPQVVVADKHPGYATTAWAGRFAERTGCELLLVQHHHAHALSLLAERHAVGQPVLVATLDGTGYGDDKTIWGGEILLLGANPMQYERVWHLPGFWQAGGDSAVRRPWKLAAGLLAACGVNGHGLASESAGDQAEAKLVASQLETHAACVWTTSAGRVFDAVASMLGICQAQTYEGQAGGELESRARRCQHKSHPWEAPSCELDDLVGIVADGYRRDIDVDCLAEAFHRGFAALIATALTQAAAQHEVSLVGLSGGVAQNQLFASYLRQRLDFADDAYLLHRVVPPNDGGLSLGQSLAGYLSVREEK